MIRIDLGIQNGYSIKFALYTTTSFLSIYLQEK